MPNKKIMLKNFRQEIDTIETGSLDKKTVTQLRVKALDVLEDTNNAGRAIMWYENQVAKLLV